MTKNNFTNPVVNLNFLRETIIVNEDLDSILRENFLTACNNDEKSMQRIFCECNGKETPGMPEFNFVIRLNESSNESRQWIF